MIPFNLVRAGDLGPPDMAYIVKGVASSHPSTGGNTSISKEVGSYHFILGVDTSSSASIAAYVSSLTYSLETNLGWFKSNPWKVIRSTYCCYNAFSRVDLRVEARIPGGVMAYAITANGSRIPTTTDMWQEAFVCSVLRAIHHDALRLTGLRRLDPLPTEIIERRFLEAASRLFRQGCGLGSLNPYLNSTNENNFLTQGIYKYFVNGQRPLVAAEFLQEFAQKEPELFSLVAKCHLLSGRLYHIVVFIPLDNEPEGVRILCDELTKHGPTLPSLLITQADFLFGKKRYKDALEIAKAAVRTSPVEFLPWFTLARIHLKLEQYDEALITLNSCPIPIWSESDVPRPVKGAKVWVPKRDNAPLDSIAASTQDSAILNGLQAPHLRGVYIEAYNILVELVRILEWDDLLRVRSQIFIMENEFGVDPKTNDNKRRDSSGMVDVPLDHEPCKYGKRLCERWLDRLFMILFEDLRALSIFRSEMVQCQNTRTSYNRTARDWLALGALCKRLGYLEEARDAFKRCIETVGFSREAWMNLLEIYAEEGRLSHALSAAVKLINFESAYFNGNLLFPSPLATIILTLVKKHGAERVRTVMVSLHLGNDAEALIQKFLDLAKNTKSLGYDY